MSKYTGEEKEAYDMGYRLGQEAGEAYMEQYSDLTPAEKEDPMVFLSALEDNWHQLDFWSYSILPTLRSLAGCKDEGYGTYTKCTDDNYWKLDELYDILNEGITDGFEDYLEEHRRGGQVEVYPNGINPFTKETALEFVKAHRNIFSERIIRRTIHEEPGFIVVEEIEWDPSGKKHINYWGFRDRPGGIGPYGVISDTSMNRIQAIEELKRALR